MLLADHEAVHEMLESFSLNENEVAEFFRDHDVEPHGIVQYGFLMTAGAAKTGGSTVKTMIALFAAGVTVGLHLADQRAAMETT